ncbi:uncharacterized protein DEA37_0012394 [Paragonimus westermani]|uniref:H15 domain-containing protein n=1 Tax=Paragonimus westermani TaxID=34504 RepID=A0A5J4NSV8_9TREM|nr:uncharacterized protein DEA37_0012394 [Paragonimus westermani]
MAAKDRKSTSLPNIKKYMAANYKVDVEKLRPHIRSGIFRAVWQNTLVRVGNKDKGASWTFKVADRDKAKGYQETPDGC